MVDTAKVDAPIGKLGPDLLRLRAAMDSEFEAIKTGMRTDEQVHRLIAECFAFVDEVMPPQEDGDPAQAGTG